MHCSIERLGIGLVGLFAVSMIAILPAGPAGAAEAAAPDTAAAGVAPEQVLLLGPIAPPPDEAQQPLLSGTAETVFEIDPSDPFPRQGEEITLVPGAVRAWRQAAVDATGELAVEAAGITWMAARVRLDRWCQLTLTVSFTGAATLFVDGCEEASGQAGEDDGPLSASVELGRGVHDVMVRLKVPAEADLPLSLGLSAAADPTADIGWNLDDLSEPADFADSRQLASISPVVVARQGKYVARRLSRRDRSGEGRQTTLDVLDRSGRLVAAALAGPGAAPLAFSPDGERLLLSRAGSEGRDLLLWEAPAGPVRTVLQDEPGLGFARFSPDGQYLLIASAKGVEQDEPDADAARRRQFLREKVSDYSPPAHLHLVEVATGARRRLTMPGDYVLDDARFLPDGGQVVYGKTVPREERPWFQTEIRLIDLRSGDDRLITTFVAGWEVRPQSFAPAPDGKRLAFVGPPEQVGDGRPEHNVYNKQIWLLDLEAGSFERITRNAPYAFDGDHNLPGWAQDGRSLFAKAYHGARCSLARVTPGPDGGAMVGLLSVASLTVGAAALADDGNAAAVTASGPTTYPALHLLAEIGKSGAKWRLLESPNLDLQARWRLSEPSDATCEGGEGQRINAWWYRPTVHPAAEETTPVVLYYYGGSSPTLYGFNFTHQWLAANGYAVLVVNPRGAYSFGDRYADHHAGDWGPRASGDILACLDRLLAERPELDADRVGIYGGSYGGFMTEYLVTVTDRFAAAVSLYGISDLATYWGQGAWGWTYGDMAVAGATPWADPTYFLERSPLYRADRITTPLLLLHGIADANVTPGESEQLFTALSMQGKPVELVLFPGEDHGISGTFANRAGHRTMMLEWFDRYLRDQPEAWEERWK